MTCESQLRQDICTIGRKLCDKGFVVANDGNISVRLSEDRILVTPTGVSKGEMTPTSLGIVDANGEALAGGRPSSEVKMHLQVYRLNPDVQAVVHAHPPLATAFAAARIPLDRPILSETIVNLGVVPVAEYALPGTAAVPESIAPYVIDYNAVLLANHGLLTWGTDLTQAYFRLETAEQYCKVRYYLRQIGPPHELEPEEVAALVTVRERLGISTGGIPGSSGSLDAICEE